MQEGWPGPAMAAGRDTLLAAGHRGFSFTCGCVLELALLPLYFKGRVIRMKTVQCPSSLKVGIKIVLFLEDSL